MRTIVRFRTAEGDYAVPVEQVLEVRSRAGLSPLPAPLPGVAGLMRRDNGALPVLTVLGPGGHHVVIVENGPLSFGLLVEEVTGVLQVDETQISAPPPGQHQPLVSGVLHGDEGLVMLLDVDALAGKLTS
jgi:chemotaxis signal transduction protein